MTKRHAIPPLELSKPAPTTWEDELLQDPAEAGRLGGIERLLDVMTAEPPPAWEIELLTPGCEAAARTWEKWEWELYGFRGMKPYELWVLGILRNSREARSSEPAYPSHRAGHHFLAQQKL